MSQLFKNAKQIILPEKMVDTKTWLSDDDILMMIKLMQNDKTTDKQTIVAKGNRRRKR